MRATIVYIVDPETHQVLLAKKLKKIGKGYWFGYGGKIKAGESPEDCIVRETLKETGDRIRLPKQGLERAALLHFYNGKNLHPAFDDPSFTVICYRIFLPKKHLKQPISTDEMGDPTWFDILQLPGDMKPGDELFVPQILLRSTVKGYIHFDDLGKVIQSSILPCNSRDLSFKRAV